MRGIVLTTAMEAVPWHVLWVPAELTIPALVRKESEAATMVVTVDVASITEAARLADIAAVVPSEAAVPSAEAVVAAALAVAEAEAAPVEAVHLEEECNR